MKYSKKQFLQDVSSEASLLKNYATEEEVAKLDFDRLRFDNRRSCIYGQMTGDCRSIRAQILLASCCKRFVANSDLLIPHPSNWNPDKRPSFNKIKEFVNGTTQDRPDTVIYLSSIETYIALKGAKPKELIDYLKGTTDTLTL